MNSDVFTRLNIVPTLKYTLRKTIITVKIAQDKRVKNVRILTDILNFGITVCAIIYILNNRNVIKCLSFFSKLFVIFIFFIFEVSKIYM